MQHTIEIPDYTPPLLNQFVGKHWAIGAKLKKECRQFIAVYGRDVPKATGRRMVRLDVWGWPKGRRPDRDAFDKATLDGLTACGLLTDDSAKWLEGRMLVEIHPSAERKTLITLEDCYYGSDCHGLHDVEDAYELFEKLSIVLGHPVNGESFTYSCSC